MIVIHLPQVHLLLEEVRKVLFPLCAIIFTTTAVPFIMPARCDVSVNLPLLYVTQVNPSGTNQTFQIASCLSKP